MKYNRQSFLLLAGLVISMNLFSQRMRIGVRPGSKPASIIITVTPDFNFNNKLNEIGFALMIPKQSPPGTPIPIPGVGVMNTCATCLNTTFPAATWVQVTDVVSDPNFYLVKLGVTSNLGTAPVLAIGNGASQDVAEIEFINSTTTPTQIRIAHLAFGGPGTQYGAAILDGSSNDLTNYVQIFTGIGVQPPAPLPDEQTGYETTQWVPLSNVVLPVNWMSFDAIKSGNNALLNWRVSDEESNKHYELLRSVNGNDFFPIATINKVGSGNGVKDYTYTDQNIDALGVGVVYYRLRQVNIDGRSSLSDIRLVKLGKGSGEIAVFPNPVKDGFYVNVPLATNDRATVTLNLVTLTGQMVKSKEITSQQASNYYFDVKGLALSAGQYNLQIVHEGKVMATKKLLITQ